MSIYTLGHSNHPPDAFLALLDAFAVDLLVDVRRYPSSRRYPQFNRPSLARLVEGSGRRYVHDERLGGHRQPVDGSPNTALEDAWRGYADHMSTAAFAAALSDVRTAASRQRTALMCAEADPSHCHRSFLSDALVLGGVEVIHVLTTEASRPHEVHPDARLEDARVVYRARQLGLFSP